MSKLNFKLGNLTIDAQAYGSQGNAVLGIRDSGKTYTATEIAEKLFEAGIPFTTFDPTGVWRFLRVPGAGRGYPVVVAGGKEGDLPLTVAGAPEIVRAAMKNGVSIVLDLTDNNLSKADWKRIVKSCVRVMLSENSQHGLRHVFIEEAAEFIPQRVIDGDVYAEVEKLARIGGNSRLGYTLINQRSQEVSKAVLELCENLFLHRQKGKNALDSLAKWFDLAEVAERKDIMKSLPNLPSGQCWAWMGGSDEIPLLIKVPPKNSHHPDRRAMRGDVVVLAKSAVDVGSFVSSMKVSLVEIEEIDKANDPKLLRAEIARLSGLVKSPATVQQAATDPAAIATAEQRGYSRGFAEAGRQASISFEALKQLASTTVRTFAESFQANLRGEKINFVAPPVVAVTPAARPTSQPTSTTRAKGPQGDSPVGGVQQIILNVVAEMEQLCGKAPPRTLVAMMANYKNVKSTGFAKALSSLSSAGHVSYPDSGTVALTDSGIGLARPRSAALTTDDVHARVIDILGETAGRILGHLLAVHPGAMDRELLAEKSGYQNVKSTGFAKALSRMSSLGFVTYPTSGTAKAGEILFP